MIILISNIYDLKMIVAKLMFHKIFKHLMEEVWEMMISCYNRQWLILCNQQMVHVEQVVMNHWVLNKEEEKNLFQLVWRTLVTHVILIRYYKFTLTCLDSLIRFSVFRMMMCLYHLENNKTIHKTNIKTQRRKRL